MTTTGDFKHFINGVEIDKSKLKEFDLSNCSVTVDGKSVFYFFPPKITKVVNEFNTPYLVVDFKTFQEMECSQVVLYNGLYGFFKDNSFYPSKFDKSKKFYVYPNVPVDLHFTEVEKEILTDRQQGYLSTRHKYREGLGNQYTRNPIIDYSSQKTEKENNMVFLCEALSDLHKERLKEVAETNDKFLQDFKKADNFIDNTLDYLDSPTEKTVKTTITFESSPALAKEIQAVCDNINKQDKKTENNSYITDTENPAEKTEKENNMYLDEVLEDLEKEQSKKNKFVQGFEKAVDYTVNTLGCLAEKTENKGLKDSQKEVKAPIFTYCKVNKNALEALALRALYGHQKYNTNGADEDWQNFTRVTNGDFEYSNASFRHALEIGNDEDEFGHLVSAAWNAVSRLEIYLRNRNADKNN